MAVFVALGKSDIVNVKCRYLHEKHCSIEPFRNRVTVSINKRDELNINDRGSNKTTMPLIEHASLLCDYNVKVTDMPTQVFESFPNLKSLSVQCKDVGDLSQSDFALARNLRNLSLQSNKIRRLETHTFSMVSKLQGIDLAMNQIEEIEDFAFDGLNDLKVLDLYVNKLMHIGKLVFAGLPSLEQLDLASNELQDIDEGALDIPKLKKLDLAYNKLTILSDRLFIGAPALIELNLCGNQIERVNNALYSLSRLEKLKLSKNTIRDFDLKNALRFPNLISLDFSENGIDLDTVSVSSVDIDASNSKVKSLSLGKNLIRSGIVFEKLKLFPNLEEVFLGHNSMNTVDLDAIRTGAGLSKLTNISLYHNDKDLNMRWLNTKTTELSMNLHSDWEYLKIIINRN